MAWEDVPNPQLSVDRDAIVRVDATTMCETELHTLKGDLPQVTDGRVLDHDTDVFIPVDAITRITAKVFSGRSREQVAGAPGYDPDLVDGLPHYDDLCAYYGPFWGLAYAYPGYPYL